MAAEINADFNLRANNRSRRAFASLNQSLRNTARSLQVIQGPLGPLAGRFTAFSTALQSVRPGLLAVSGGLAVAGLAATRALRQWADTESQLIQLESQLKATSFAAGQSSQDLENLAQGVAQATLASLQEVREAQGILISFRSISGEAFGEALRQAQNLAAAGFGSMRTAAIQLGKALEDPENGLDGLARAGTKFTQSQKDAIAAMVEAGDKAGALNAILGEVNKQVGGAGAGAAGGLAGAFDTLTQSVENFWAALGRTLAASGFQSATSDLAKLIQNLADAIGGLESMTTERLTARLKEIGVELANNAELGRLSVGRLQQEFDEITRILRYRKLESELAERRAEIAQREIAAEEERARRAAEAKERAEEQAKAAEKLAKEFEKIKAQLDPIAALSDQWSNAVNTILQSTQQGSGIQQRLLTQADQFFEKKMAEAQLQDEIVDKWEQTRDMAKEATSTLASGIADALIDASSLNDALQDTLRQIAKLIVQRTIVQGLTNAIGGLFPGATQPGTVSPFANPRPATAAIGGNRRGPTIVGERGPELLNLPGGSKIIPNHRMSSGGASVVINNNALPEGQIQTEEQDDGTVVVNLVRSIIQDEMNDGQTGLAYRQHHNLRRRGVTR